MYLYAILLDFREPQCKSLSINTFFFLSSDKLVVSTSCSLLHTAVDLVNETKLDKELKSWLAFAAQKLHEVNGLAKALSGQKDEVLHFPTYFSILLILLIFSTFQNRKAISPFLESESSDNN